MTKHRVMRQMGRAMIAMLLACLMVFTLVVSRNDKLVGAESTGLKQYYESDYASKDKTLEAGLALNQEIAEEGFILLKNEGSLPVATSSAKKAKISVFGKNSKNMVVGGSGSGSNAGAKGTTEIYGVLKKAGYDVNPTLEEFYADNKASGSGRANSPGMGRMLYGFGTGETPQTMYTQAVKDSYAQYNDAAIVVISRIGGEGYELPRYSSIEPANNKKGTEKLASARDINDHYLQLDQYETDMIKAAGDAFKNVIVIINSSTSMELGFLDDPTHYAYHANIKGAIWVGGIGSNGISAIGGILNGTVNPSGRTVDTYVRDFKKDPTWNNIGDNNEENGNRYTVDGKNVDAYVVDYEESIYMGYRYWETRAFEEKQKDAATKWYQNNVVYPLGYGLSYTSFEWTIKSSAPVANAALTKDGSIVVTVNVKNTGTKAGKDVVQLYYTAPYTANGIEKAHVVLGDFVKTPEIAAGGNVDVTLTLKVEDMASYDFADVNQNQFKGYEVEAGDYKLWVSKNAHDTNADLSVAYTVAGGFKYDKRSSDKTTVENQFDDVNNAIKTQPGWTGIKRSEITTAVTSTRTAAQLATNAVFVSSLNYAEKDGKIAESYRDATDAWKDTASQPWFYETLPAGVTYQQTKLAADARIQFETLIGVPFDDAKWDAFMNQFTLEEMGKLIVTGAYNNMPIPEIGKPNVGDVDGPSGVNGTGWVSECVIAATWNIELAEAMGTMIGEESLWTVGKAFSGWYAPAMNIHRSQFSGRNFEYYSEDGFLSGKLAAAVCVGAQSKGVYTFIKHFAVNDQETSRDANGLVTYVDEQTMREIYFKPFEMAVKEGGSRAVMSSFNRIGTIQACGSYALLTEVLRNEWGFEGMVITDFNLYSYMQADMCIRAGNDKMLSFNKAITMDKDVSPTQIMALRKSAKNILYTVVNSNAMNESVNVAFEKTVPAMTVGVGRSVTVELPELKITSSYGSAIPKYEVVATGSASLKNVVYDSEKNSVSFTTADVAARSQSISFSVQGAGIMTVVPATISVTVGFDYTADQFVGLAKYGEAFTGSVAGVEGTSAATTYALASGQTLPEGLAINRTTGALTGTVAATVLPGVYKFKVTATSNRINVDKQFTIVVSVIECENPEDHDNVCPNPDDHENVCPNPEDHENVCPNPDDHEHVCPNPDDHEHVCPNPDDHDNVCKNPEDHDNVCKNPEDHNHVCPDPSAHEKKGCGSSMMATTGGIIGGAFAIIAMAATMFFVLKRKSKENK